MGMNSKYSLSDAFSTFIETDSAQKADRSQKADRRFLDLVLHFFNTSRKKTTVQEITLEDLERLQIWLKNGQQVGSKFKEPWTQTTIQFYCRTLKKFFRKMQHMDYIVKNPADYWKVLRGTNKARRAMTKEEFAKIHDAAPDWFKPVLMFMRLTGARGASTADICWADIDLKKGVLVLTSRKGGAGQSKSIPIPIYPALEEFLKSHPKSRSSDPLFWGPNGFPVTAQEISTEGSRLIRKIVGLRGVVLYGLRHSVAVEMTTAGIPLETVRQAMGHSSIAQTSHYAKGIASDVVKDAFDLIRNKNERKMGKS